MLSMSSRGDLHSGVGGALGLSFLVHPSLLLEAKAMVLMHLDAEAATEGLCPHWLALELS